MTSFEAAAGGLQCGYAATPGGQIHYCEAGQGEAILLLHSTPRSLRSFRHVLPLLGSKLRAIAVDTPGFGGSPRLSDGFSIETLAGSLIDFMDAMKIERAHVFGLHTGNKIAAALACGWPERLISVVLAGQTHSIHPDPPARNAAIRAFLTRYTPLHASGVAGDDALRDWVGAHATVQGFWWPATVLRPPHPDPHEVEHAHAKVLDYLQGWTSVMPMYDAILAFDLMEAIGRIKVPALVLELLTADEAHFGAQGPKLCAAMPAATYAALDDADGSVLETRASELAGKLLAFLERVRASRARA